MVTLGLYFNKSDTKQQKLPIPFYLARFPRLFPELLKSGQAGQRSQEVMEVSRQRGNNVCNCAGGGKDYSVFFFCPHTSSCQKSSKWCCLRPTICNWMLIPHRRPAFPQTGEKGCGNTVFREDQELNSHLSLVEGRSQRWQDCCRWWCLYCLRCRQSTLVLQGRFFFINT